jgi:hypothetical protein
MASEASASVGSSSAASPPIAAAPVTLTTSVPQGKVSPKRCATTPETQYRAIPPTAPPTALVTSIFSGVSTFNTPAIMLPD